MAEDVVSRMRSIYCCEGTEFARPELQAGWEEIQRLRQALTDIEERLREDAAPLANLAATAGGPDEKRAWKAVYSSAIHAQNSLKAP